METFRARGFLAVVLLSLVPLFAAADTEIRSVVVEGRGDTRESAIIDGLAEAVRQVKRLRLEQYTAFVNGTLRSLIRARDAGELTLPDKELSPYRWASAAWSASENLVKRLADTFGWEEAEAILTYAPQKRQETVRYNSLRMTEPEMDRLIEKRGWVCERVEESAPWL